MTIRAVVFDFGGVLFDWSPHHLYRKLIADDQERQWFLDNICTQAWNTEQDAGRPLAEATQILIDQHPHPRDSITAYYEMTWPTTPMPPALWVGRTFIMYRPSRHRHDCVNWA